MRGELGNIKMTPEVFTSWLLPVALAACALAGFAVVSVCVRSGWTQSITWALVSFGLIGAMMLLSPKWTTFALEYGDLRATVAELRQENTRLSAENAHYAEQIEKVSGIATAKFTSAQDLVETLKLTREAVGWADFLPANKSSYGVAISPESEQFKNTLSGIAGEGVGALSKLFEDNNWTVVKPASSTDLSETPANALWITPNTLEAGPADEKSPAN